MGLPAAPSASARYSSGIMTPSNMSGALPMTTASMSLHVRPASSSARMPPPRARAPAMETSGRFDGVASSGRSPIDGASRIALIGVDASIDAHQVLLQARAGGRVRDGAARRRRR